jgi:hypothetical protein
MKLSPEIAMYIRDAMKYGGALLVALGYITTKDADAATAMSELAIPLVEALGGLAMAAIATVWAHLAKKPASNEAQVIAGRVAADPVAEPIAPKE